MIYSAKALTAQLYPTAAAAVEDRRGAYVCGEPLFEPGLPLAAAAPDDLLRVREDLECSTHVELTYYAYVPTPARTHAQTIACAASARRRRGSGRSSCWTSL